MKNTLRLIGGALALSAATAFAQTPAPLYQYGPECFRESPSNPLLTHNSELDGADWNDPSVLKVGGQYVMYASSDKNFNLEVNIYRLVSNDRKSWKLSPTAPVLTRGSTANAFDRRAVETPSVVFFQNRYHMFYTGYATAHTDTASYRIGHAVSSDGIKWVKDAAPVVSPKNPRGPVDLSFNQFLVGEPGAVVFNNKIYLYFTALGADVSVGTTLQTIGLVTSGDGVSWTAPQVALKPSQALFPRSSWIGYSTPAPVVINNQVHLFYDVVQASPWRQQRLHRATSANGLSGWAQDARSIFTTSDFSWSAREIRAPAVLAEGASLRLFFAGDDGATLGIGSADCTMTTVQAKK